MTTLTRHSKVFLEAAAKVATGEADRVEIATELGINPGTFAVWMSRSGIKVVKANRQRHGAALGWSFTDPDKAKALDDAAALVLSGALSVTEAAAAHPTVAVTTIAARVRRTREKLGIPIKRRRTQAEMAAIRAEEPPK